MGRNVICISREFGAAGEEVGVLAARELGYQYVDGEILARAAEKGHLDAGWVANAEHRQSVTEQLLEEEIVVGARHDDVRRLIKQAIDDFAAAGSAVIVAHAASHALAGRTDVLRVFVTGSPSVRAARIRGDSTASDDALLRQITNSDSARAAYLEEFYGVNDELATQYDLVVNTDILTPEAATQIVVRAAQV